VKRLVAVLLLVLVTATAAAQAAPRQAPLQFVTVVENRIWTESPDEADSVAKLIVDAGFNSVRIFVPYSLGQAEIENDALRLCNAAVAARDNGLKLIVSILGVKGHVPQGWAHVDRFIKTLNDHMYWLFGENGCTADVKDFYVEILNEPNSKAFWRNQYDSEGNWIAPERYVRILSRVYPALKAKAAELDVQVTVLAGALASNHQPLEFIRLMGEEIKRLGAGVPLFDIFSHHPYPANSSESPDTPHPAGNVIGIADYDQLVRALKSAFGYVPWIFYDEYGIETVIPNDQRYRYWGKSADSVKPVPEATQAEFYTQALRLCAEQPKVIGCAIFHLFDDPQLEWWQSGLYYYPDQIDDEHRPVAKSSLPDVRLALLEALGAL